jgi:rhodanese-related sulfurtransferase
MKKVILAAFILSAVSAFADTTATTTTNTTTTTTATTSTNCKDENHYPIVSKAELKTLLQSKDTVVFDVNGPDSFKKAHVPGAIDFVTNEKTFTTMLPKDKTATIVAYCGGPMCEAWQKAATKACAMGYTNIKHYKDGIIGWVKN